MSISELCVGDIVKKRTKSLSVGTYGGDAGTWSESSTEVDCRVEELSASEVERFAARGMMVTHRVYFASDVVLTNANALHWIERNGVARDVYLQVQGYRMQTNPTGDLELWIVEANAITSRNDQAD